ncbi:hypothetical protein [Bacillus cereus]|uniref:hypothetical protein n=1 Tax=Bacillus cereus TaxID=1396 RepID=UPI000B4BB6D8|nr:hypothetical protein [Bacillus cereus]
MNKLTGLFIGLGLLLVPFSIDTVNASPIKSSTNSSISISPGDFGFSQTISNDLFFQPYQISTSKPNQNNTSTHKFEVSDFSGRLTGWTVSATFSDFVLDENNDGVAEDRLSKHGSSIDFKCSLPTFKSLPHACQTDLNKVIGSSGTSPSIIAAATATSASVGKFEYTLPVGFFSLKFNNDVKPGIYKGTLTLDFGSVYTP